ncbi:MAG TPA: hypothetical protein VG456_18245 [Candidatus Sulfopaludibacter sp.]|nr:hypothetical protein [Candidatus Sulfopaludibacter sp.]
MSVQTRRFPLQGTMLLIIGSGVFGSYTAGRAQSIDLDRLAGRDLWRDRASDSEMLAIKRLIGEIPKGFVLQPAPWHVWETTSDGQPRYVVLLGEALSMIPGGSSACLQLFDAGARKIASSSFQIGWRSMPVDASLEYSRDAGTDFVVLHMTPVVNGRPIAKEYFAINHDQIRLVRLENDKGEIVQNDYVFPNAQIGPVPDAKTPDQWARLLQSKDLADVLSALTFLGGRHLPEPARNFDGESKYAGMFQQLLGSSGIRELIVHLETSDHEWVRQAATLAARGARERLLY